MGNRLLKIQENLGGFWFIIDSNIRLWWIKIFLIVTFINSKMAKYAENIKIPKL